MRSIVSIIALLSLNACVSLDLQKDIPTAEGVLFAAPKSGFESESVDNLDHHWIQKSTGNSISLKSSCFDPADPDLNYLSQSSFNGLKVEEEIKTETIQYNKREALHTKKKVNIDGIKVIVELVVLKKNNCNYILSHVGIDKNFNTSAGTFAEFTKSFKAP
ncbi:MAG: hypothetical protein AB8E15_12515 [Bdellovibrionales bacterium]